MKQLMLLLLCFACCNTAISQNKTVAQIKTELEKSTNPPLYVKDVLKKRFKLDTIVVPRIGNYTSLSDSLAYTSKINKVYGPFTQKGSRFLVQVLAKLPTTFIRVSQIFLDTSVFRYRFADSLADVIIQKIKTGSASFEQLAQTYSMGGESSTQGDLGWIAHGILLPVLEHEVLQHKKNEVFKIWTRSGVHVLKRTQEPKQDTGFALMMRVFL